MAKITLTINLDNDAFTDDWREEVARLLLVQSRQLKAGWHPTPTDLPTAVVWDVNGNTVGGWTFDPEIPSPAADVWLGNPDAATWAQLLEQLPTLGVGQDADRKIELTRDHGYHHRDLRVWLSRMGVEAGEPFARTVYVEELRTGAWLEIGHYDGDQAGLDPGEAGAAAALTYTRDLAWERS